ncbi:MAG: hypothetical protein FJ267_13725, partial [Planctomycetes bacterium]|nr:hypothetical protein [Planctomycetota bacterium]
MFKNYALDLNGQLVGRIQGANSPIVSPSFADVTDANVTTGDGTTVGNRGLTTTMFRVQGFDCGAGMSRTFYEWIRSATKDMHQNRSVVIYAQDTSTRQFQSVAFRNPTLTEFSLPALNRTSKLPALIETKFRPEFAKLNPLEAKLNRQLESLPHAKPWFVNDFRFVIDGLESDCKRVSTVAPFVFGWSVKPFFVGKENVSILQPTHMKSSILTITLPQANATGFMNWLQDIIKKGTTTTQNQKNALLEYLAPGSKQTYFELKLTNLDISKISNDTKGNSRIEMFY